MAIYAKLWDIMVNMFKGIHNINLDAKGRLTIPTKYRNTISDQSSGNMVVTIDPEEIEKKINALPNINKNARRIQRLLLGHAEDLELDKNGRILLSKPLRTVTEITKKIMLIGQGEKFEIWSEDTWNNRVNTWRSEETDESEESALSDIRL